jgi:hypothetical protein
MHMPKSDDLLESSLKLGRPLPQANREQLDHPIIRAVQQGQAVPELEPANPASHDQPLELSRNAPAKLLRAVITVVNEKIAIGGYIGSFKLVDGSLDLPDLIGADRLHQEALGLRHNRKRTMLCPHEEIDPLGVPSPHARGLLDRRPMKPQERQDSAFKLVSLGDSQRARVTLPDR